MVMHHLQEEDDLDNIEQNTIEYDPMLYRYLTYTDAGIDDDETNINRHLNSNTDMTVKSIGRNEIKANELGLLTVRTDCLEFLMDIECMCNWSSSHANTPITRFNRLKQYAYNTYVTGDKILDVIEKNLTNSKVKQKINHVIFMYHFKDFRQIESV